MVKEKKDDALMGKEKVFAFRWDTELITLWEKAAQRFNRKGQATTAARDLLEEYLCCFLSDEELEKFGLIAYRTYPPPRLADALRQAKRMRKSSTEEV